MSDEIKDMLAGVSADIDQAQAMIDEGRRMSPDNKAFQKELDKREFLLDVQRTRVRNMRTIDKMLDS